jgi:hypothetical protein
MPSPFPGMNPYIEQAGVWNGFHLRFMTFAAEQLGKQVRPRYFVKIAEHVYQRERSAVDEERQAYLEIRDREGRQVVTVIELLSPSNKYAGSDHDLYWNKVRALLLTPTHFVEIDLLRGGPRMPWEEMPACDYYAFVSRYEQRPRADFWPIRLREPIPPIPIPLRPGEAEPRLDIQALIHRIYDSADYELSIYDGEPEPRLSPEDAAWASGLRPAR